MFWLLTIKNSIDSGLKIDFQNPIIAIQNHWYYQMNLRRHFIKIFPAAVALTLSAASALTSAANDHFADGAAFDQIYARK
jgi:ABC-type sulfate transport system substrate-binding protein